MPRQARRKSRSGIYHIMLRGINRQQIFEDKEDFDKYIDVLKDCKAVSGFELYAYCLMGNHIHLLLKPVNEPLELIFKRIGSRYVYWYNWKYGRTGHLFQDRFKSEPVDTDEYFLTVLRYIHNNPKKARLCSDVYSYEYSSAEAYRSGKSAYVDLDFTLQILKKDELLEFLKEPSEEVCMDLETDSVRLSDSEAVTIIRKVTGINNSHEIQNLETAKRDLILKKLRQSGISIRQISRLTGVSFNVVRKF